MFSAMKEDFGAKVVKLLSYNRTCIIMAHFVCLLMWLSQHVDRVDMFLK